MTLELRLTAPSAFARALAPRECPLVDAAAAVDPWLGVDLKLEGTGGLRKGARICAEMEDGGETSSSYIADSLPILLLLLLVPVFGADEIGDRIVWI